MKYGAIVMFPNYTGQPTTGCIAIFHKYCGCMKHGGIIKKWIYEVLGGMLLICQNAPVRVWGTWISLYYVLGWKIYSIFEGPVLVPIDSRRAARGARICENRLLISHVGIRPRSVYFLLKLYFWPRCSHYHFVPNAFHTLTKGFGNHSSHFLC